ncbi:MULTISPECIES: 3-phosphoserine/phosphohydroxythreonine transaminase [Myroides]|uniref:Phosphoserine aminotransferase n=1 Tax=Myroides albus TaxID=2562892 RepID=A0A6I3LKA0_9FLAO|nr:MULTISPECIES: 3-phosphoserine/phosphohydroxythreonine transaminase [Myroides]MTG97670.1 3-phosphoserine/phosphohydroxythreonine transaminase [Myroides albus]MVX35669.1 3-phosphoserine/phosphohydroxythreonine transaminase [Myroides sp. LoEW2-1]UVD78784.1 3-phosphoserine/phosphohydroxythreonine transaminase [Myroides albus]
MSQIHNFCAGPCLLPEVVYQQAAQALIDFDGSGMSILSISHRSSAFLAVLDEVSHLALDLLGLDKGDYDVLFLQGGASMEFLRIPYNMLSTKAGYINTGVWASKAIEQAHQFGQVKITASSENNEFKSIPKGIVETSSLDYLHFTSNNTIYGTQFDYVPQANCPIVCDMSSDIYSRVFDYNKIDVIYAGAQKNIGPAGLSVVFIRKGVLNNKVRFIPNMLNYQEHISKGSLYHTANVFAIYTTLLNLRWLKSLGGVEAIEKVNIKKAATLYEAIDSLDFVRGIAESDSRSKMNVTFDFVHSSIDKLFDEMCVEAGIKNIRGHRTLGGYRASLYNALPLNSVTALVEVLREVKHKI